jgi:uncharacterized membrane protein
VPLLVLKLVVTPLLIGGASLAARRWGPLVGGWLVALPLTSGPVLFFLALDHGPAFAADAAVGSLLGLAAIVAFILAYAVASPRGPWLALAAATIAYLVVGLALRPFAEAPFVALVALVVTAIALALRLVPAPPAGRPATVHPAWDLPARVVVGTALVVGLTAIAPLLGPVTSGLVSTFPVYVSVLTAFAQLNDGRNAALGVLRGLLVGLFGTTAFNVVVRVLLPTTGIGVTFAAAVAITLAIQAITLARLHPGEPLPEPA